MSVPVPLAPAPARLDQGASPHRARATSACGRLMRDLEPPHGLRGGALSERRRLLEPRDRHVHDPGRRLHPRLRLLRGQDRTPRPGRPIPASRAASPTPWRGWACVTPSSPRSTATTRRTAAPRSSRRASARSGRASPGCAVEVLIPDFKGELGRPEDRDRRAARHPEPQHRDRAAPLPRRCAPGPASSARSSCCGGPRRRASSPRAASWWASGRSGTRSWSASGPSAAPGPTSSPSGSTCAPASQHLPLRPLLHPGGVRGASSAFAPPLGLRPRGVGAPRALLLPRRRAGASPQGARTRPRRSPGEAPLLAGSAGSSGRTMTSRGTRIARPRG